jgi:hypothetical protein
MLIINLKNHQKASVLKKMRMMMMFLAMKIIHKLLIKNKELILNFMGINNNLIRKVIVIKK